jgi:hypothetical protein
MTIGSIQEGGHSTSAVELVYQATANVRMRSVDWSFGDSAGTSGQNRLTESHRYTAAGAYFVETTGLPIAGSVAARASRAFTLEACAPTLCLKP